MGFENKAGLGVNNHYGVRDTGGTAGVEHSKDAIHNLSVYFTGESVSDGFLPPVVIPKGAHFLRYVLTVDEAFVLGGTTPTITVGGTLPATNGVVFTEAELEAVGSKIPTSTGAGTWSVTASAGTTAAEKVDVVLGGTTPTIDRTKGKATLTAEFVYKVRV